MTGVGKMFFNLEGFIDTIKQYVGICVTGHCNMSTLDIQGVWVEMYCLRPIPDYLFYVRIGIHEPEDNNIVHWFSTPRIYLGQGLSKFDESIDNAVRAIANLGVFKNLMTDSLGTL